MVVTVLAIIPAGLGAELGSDVATTEAATGVPAEAIGAAVTTGTALMGGAEGAGSSSSVIVGGIAFLRLHLHCRTS